MGLWALSWRSVYIQSKITRYGTSTGSLAKSMVENGPFWASMGSVYESSVIAANEQAGQTGGTKYVAVYQPPRSTDILLQEFIARGPNDADVAMVYESIALHRWQQSAQGQRESYQIYYLNPTIETVATGAIVSRGAEQNET